MKRTPLKRGKPLTRKTRLARTRASLERKGRINPVNRKRRKKAYARNFGDYADVIRGLPCDTCGAPPPSDPSHAKSRGAGGSRRHLVPQCRVCHDLYGEAKGPSREHMMERADHYWRTYGDGDG